MCPVCLATMSLYVAGGASAGGITSYLAARLLDRGQDQPVDESKRRTENTLEGRRAER